MLTVIKSASRSYISTNGQLTITNFRELTMADDTLKQNTVDFQQCYKKIIERIKHIHMLIEQVKQECGIYAESLPEHEANCIQQLILRTDLALNQFGYVINKIDDMHKQQINKPLILNRKNNDKD